MKINIEIENKLKELKPLLFQNYFGIFAYEIKRWSFFIDCHLLKTTK